MAFQAIIHGPASPERRRELYHTFAQFRAEKTAKYLGAMGITYDTVRECLDQERIHNKAFKAN